ncbi:hypothetical protein P3W24_06755 [Luteibacter sp. PPL201]|uniref:Ankyrin repeat domain-containing protein n=1 Tax=Luteibacter sahnii TaxID=3021977 RepID=A0ABT6B963_9GAMM
MTRKSRANPFSLPTNTTSLPATGEGFPVVRAFLGDGVALAALVPGIDPRREMFWHDGEDGELVDLTLMAKAVAVDSESRGCLFVPILHRLGVPLDAVDSEGRTLLHFARSLPVFRYLVEHGVPVPNGMRGSLRQVMAPDGLRLPIDAGEALSFTDHNRLLPPLVAWRMRGVAASRDCIEPVCIPPEKFGAGLPEWRLKGLSALGYADATAIEGAGMRFSVAEEMKDCMFADADRGDAFARLKRLARMDLVEGWMPMWSMFGERDEAAWMTPQGFATVRDSEAEEPFWLKAFPKTTLTGVHGEGGRSLLHLANNVDVCRWLLAHGVAPDIKNDEGQYAEELLPDDAAAVVLQERMKLSLPTAVAASTRRRL